MSIVTTNQNKGYKKIVSDAKRVLGCALGKLEKSAGGFVLLGGFGNF